jgi:hypothetical protein
MSKSLWSRSVWNSLFNRVGGPRRVSRRRNSLRTNWKNGVPVEALEERLVLAGVAVTVDSATGMLSLQSAAGSADNDTVAVKAGATFTEVLVGGRVTTRIDSLNSGNIQTINFNGQGGTDTLNISGINSASLTVNLTDVEKVQLNATSNTTISSSSTATTPAKLTLVTSAITGTLSVTHNGEIDQSGKVIVSGATSVSAGGGARNVSLTNGANSFGDLSFTANNLTFSESGPTTFAGTNVVNGTLTVTSTGSISGTGLDVDGATSLTSNGSSINVSGAFNTNTSAQTISLKGTGVTFTDTNGSVDLKTVTATSDLNVTTSNGAINHTGGNITVGGLATFSAGSTSNITLTAGSNNFGSLSVTGGTIAVTEKSSTDLASVSASGGGDFTLTSSGAITDSGVVTVGGATSLTAKNSPITLDTATSTYAGTVTFAGATATSAALTDNDGATALGGSTVKGNLSVTTTGTGAGISQSGALIVSGRLTATATGKDIVLTSSNKAGSVSLFGKDVSFTESDATDLFDSTVTEDFVLSSGGAVTDSGNISVTATTSITAGTGKSITLDGTSSTYADRVNLSSSTGAGTLVNGTTTELGNVSLKTFTLHSTGAVTQDTSSTVSVTGLASIDATGASVNIGTAASTTVNLGTGAFKGTDVTLNEDSATNLGASVVTGNLMVVSTPTTGNGGVTDSGDIQVDGTTTITANNSGGATTADIILDASGSTYGISTTTTDLILTANRNISVVDNSAATKLGNTSATGTLTVVADGPITDVTGASISVAGTNKATFSTSGTGAGFEIDLDNDNNFTGAISLIGEDARVASQGDSVNLGTTNVETLTVNTTSTTDGNLTQSGAVKVGGTTTLTTGTGNIDLDDNGFNSFGDLILSTTTGSASITERGSTEIGTSSVGSLTVLSTGGIENSGTDTLTVTGATSLTANGGAITLGSNNALGGTVDLIATGDILLKNDDAGGTALGDVSTPGDFTLTSTAGAVTQSGDARVGDLATVTATTFDISLGGSNQFGRLSFDGNTVTINEINGTVLEAANADDGLTITSGGNIEDNDNVTVDGTTTLTAGATGTQNITLDETGNMFDELELSAGVAVIFNSNAAGTMLGTSTLATSLNLTSADDVTQTGNVSVGNALTINAGSGTDDVDLDEGHTLSLGTLSVVANNVSVNEGSANGIILGASTIGGNLSLTAAGAVTDSGTLSVSGTTTISAGSNSITLDHTDVGGDPDNTFTGKFAATGGAIILASGGNLLLGNISASSLNISADGDVTNVLTVGTGTTDGTYGDIDVTGATTIDASLGANNHTVAIDTDNSGSSFGSAPVITANLVDTSNPIVVVTSSSATANSGDSVTITFTFDSSVSGLVVADVTIGGTGTFSQTSNTGFGTTTTTFTLTGTVTGNSGDTITFQIAANKAQKDPTGLGNLASNVVTVTIN